MQDGAAGTIGAPLTLRPRLSILCVMTKEPRQQPQLSEHGKAEAARRQERLAAALRDNLRKRKQQARGREDKLSPKEKG